MPPGLKSIKWHNKPMASKTYTEEEVQKRIDMLSEEAADFLYSTEMGIMVKQIADKHKLHIDQMALLEAEVGELMLGLTEPQEFVPNLVSTLSVSEETAQAVAKQINDEVMSKMRHLMGAPGPSSSTPPTSVVPTPSFAPQTTSVVMPSSPKPVVPPVSVPAAPVTPVAPAVPPASATPAPVVAPVPAPVHDLVAADAILSEKKVVPPPATTPTAATPAAPATPMGSPAAKTDPAQPQNYKADPYREPVE